MNIFKFFLVFIASIFTILITRIIKNRFPKSYFAINHILLSDKKTLTYEEVITLFAPVYLGSIILSVLFRGVNIEYIFVYGLLTAFLLIWPVLLYSKELLILEVYKKKEILNLLYFFYIVTTMTVSYGGYVTFITINNLLNKNKISFNGFLNFYDNINPFYQNAIWTGILIFLGKTMDKIKGFITK